MPREIKNRALKKELISIDPELANIQLMKDDGYFYLTSSNNELWGDRIGEFYFNSVLVNNFKDLSIREWVYEIIDVLIQNRFDVCKEMEPWQIKLKAKAMEARY